MDGWYVLEASAPHRCRMPVRDNALPAAVAAGESLAADYFRGWLSYRALFGQWFLRLWWTARPPESLWEVDRVAARGECLLAVGPLDEVVVELRHTVDGLPHRYRIARRVAPDSSSCTVRFGLGHAVTARADEVFDVDAAAELFCAYYRTGTVPGVEYVLRELDSPDVLTDFGAQTHVLTVEYDQLRPVLATVADGEFAKVLHEFEVDAGFAVLVLSPLPSGRTWTELAGDEATGTEEFVQAAGSAGRYLVEWRRWDGEDYRVFVIGRHAASQPGHLPTDIPITFDGHLQHVHPDEVFTPAEVDLLLVHYTRTGALPERGYSYREITFDS
ncbi:hypothetical protein [Nocardia sp. NPDC050175]|uniref:hypothetical protein n=1 Tax=Nocardia sp. NPDC050175 TaxID=3364317 RepID=UPI0037ACCE9B